VTPTPSAFTELFFAAEVLLRDFILPGVPSEGDPNPMLLVLLEEGGAPVVIHLAQVYADAKDEYALVLAALVQALNPLAVATVLPVWLRSATPNREAVMVSCADRQLTALGMLYIQREPGKSPSISDIEPPRVSDQESGRFSGLFDQDTSSLPPTILEGVRARAQLILDAHPNARRDAPPRGAVH
jgi:hypothetical protein